jgi:hypothetical protein
LFALPDQFGTADEAGLVMLSLQSLFARRQSRQPDFHYTLMLSSYLVPVSSPSPATSSSATGVLTDLGLVDLLAEPDQMTNVTPLQVFNVRNKLLTWIISTTSEKLHCVTLLFRL